jgi:uncharacterized protein
MRTLRRAVYLAAVLAVLGSGLTACDSGPAGGGSVSTMPASPARSSSAPRAAVSREVSFVVGGTATYGTLAIPAHRPGQRLAAALLIAGSGPTDRNGNDVAANLTPNILQLIAGVLARMGIMSLRFDKYFSGQTDGGTFAADPGSIDLAAYIRQADAAYGFLRAQPQTDTGKMLVVGHSEGGMYALLVAESVSPHPAGLALIEPQDERLLTLIRLQADEQIDAAVSQGTLTTASGARNKAGVRKAISEFRAGQPVEVSGLAPGVVQLIAPELLSPVNARYVRSDDAVYPPSAAARLARGTRVLITDGTTDTNVPVSTIHPLADALTAAGATGPGLRVLDGVDHLLHPPGGSAPTQVLAPAAVAALRAWAAPFELPSLRADRRPAGIGERAGPAGHSGRAVGDDLRGAEQDRSPRPGRAGRGGRVHPSGAQRGRPFRPAIPDVRAGSTRPRPQAASVSPTPGQHGAVRSPPPRRDEHENASDHACADIQEMPATDLAAELAPVQSVAHGPAHVTWLPPRLKASETAIKTMVITSHSSSAARGRLRRMFTRRMSPPAGPGPACTLSSAGISSPDASRVNMASRDTSVGSELVRPSRIESRARCSHALRLIADPSISPWPLGGHGVMEGMRRLMCSVGTSAQASCRSSAASA